VNVFVLNRIRVDFLGFFFFLLLEFRVFSIVLIQQVGLVREWVDTCLIVTRRKEKENSTSESQFTIPWWYEDEEDEEEEEEEEEQQQQQRKGRERKEVINSSSRSSKQREEEELKKRTEGWLELFHKKTERLVFECVCV